jgi:hypothetical protein
LYGKLEAQGRATLFASQFELPQDQIAEIAG